MRSIWKFPLNGFNRANGVEMPRGANLLCVQMQNGTPTLWALVDDDLPFERRKLAIYGTGWDLPTDLGRYVGTFQDGPFVWHLFDQGV